MPSFWMPNFRTPGLETTLWTSRHCNILHFPVQRKPSRSLNGKDPAGMRAQVNTFHRRRGGMGQQGDDHVLLSTVTVRRKCKQLLQSIAHLLQRLWLKSFHQPSFNLTPFWDVCLSARKCLITFEYKGSSLATKEIILKYCIQRSFPLLILFFLLNPMNVSWDRWY